MPYPIIPKKNLNPSQKQELPDNIVLPPSLKGKKVLLVNHSDTLGEAAAPPSVSCRQ